MPELTFTVSEETAEKMQIYSQITEKEVDIEKCILEYICMFIPERGINQKAVYLKGSSEIEKIIAENEGRKVEIEEMPCTVINKVRMFNRVYYRIVLNGKILSVGEESLRFEEKKEPDKSND